MQERSTIVADGGKRLCTYGGYAAERRRLQVELARTLEFDRTRMSWWKRLWWEVKLRRAMRVELNKKFPPAALHVAG